MLWTSIRIPAFTARVFLCLLFMEFVIGLAPMGIAADPSQLGFPADHEATDQNELAATDLSHGQGLAMLAVRRTWRGNESLKAHFGSGWSDDNVVRLTLLDPDRILIWRGGIGWRSGNRQEDGSFITADGDTIRKTPTGWSSVGRSGLKLEFDQVGRLLSESSSAARKRTYTYDDRGQLLTVGDSPENRLRYHYEGDRVIRVEGPEGLVVQIQYDEQGRLTAVTNDRKIKFQYQYDEANQLVSAADSLGNHIKLPLPDVAPQQQPAEQELSLDAYLQLPQPIFKFDDQGRMVEEQLDGWLTKYAYDDADRVNSEMSPAGSTTYEYDGFGRVIGITHPDHRSTRIQYNNLDLPVSILGPDGVQQTLKYDSHGQLLRREVSPREWEEFEYDASGQITARRQSPAYEERYTYDSQGRVSAVQYSSGAKVSYTYGNRGAEMTEKWSSGEWTRRSYDDLGRDLKSENSAGRKTSYQYDEQGRLTEITDNVTGKVSYSYGERDTEFKVDHEGVGQTSFETTSWGKPTVTTSGTGVRTSLRYNPRGRPLEVSRQSSWRYEYDPADRLVGIRAPSGFETKFARDDSGRVAAITRGAIEWRKYQYDEQGRLSSESSATGVAATNEYSADGQETEIRFPDGVVKFARDPDGVTTTTQGPGYQIIEKLHPSGELAGRTYLPAQLELQLPLDAQGRTAGIQLNEIHVHYEYNAIGQLSGIQLPDKTAIQVQYDEGDRPARIAFGKTLKIAVTYDQASRVTRIEATAQEGETIFRESYRYDPAGNVTGIEGGSNPSRRLAYDAEDQLVKSTVGSSIQSFSYDVDGNLKSIAGGKAGASWTLDPMGRPKAREQLQYRWDASGNLTTTEGPASKIENHFDAAGRLTRRQVGNLTWEFGYLPDGDRLWQRGPRGKTWYMYQPEGLAGYKDPAGITWLVVTLPGTDWPLALCNSSGETLFLVADRLRSVRRTIDLSGTVVGRVEYGPFGNRESAEGMGGFEVFAGMLREESGLYYARQRYYDPHLARFISMDPEFGFTELPVSQNAYAYAANNPYRYRDTSGASAGWADAMPKIAARKAGFKPPRFPATEIRAGLDIMQHPESAELLRRESQDALARIGRSLERNQRILQNPHVSEAARQRAQQAIERMANQVTEISKEFRQNNMSKMGERFTPKTRPSTPTGQVNPAAPKPSGTRKVAQAAEQAALEAAEESAKQGAREGAKQGVQQATREAESSIAKRWGGRLLRGAGTILEIATIVELTEKNIDATRTLLASNEEIDSRREANAVRDRLKNLVRQKLDDPTQAGRIIPRDDSGKPDSIDALIGKIDNNILNGRKPLDGVLTDAGNTVPAAAQQGLQAALNAARGEITRGRVLELTIRKALTSAAQQENTAQVKAANAAALAREKLPIYQRMKLLPVVAAEVKSLTEKANADVKAFNSATDAMLKAAESAQSNADTICGYAAQSSKATEEQLKSWRSESLGLLQQSTRDVQAAQRKVDNMKLSTDSLRAAIGRLQTYKEVAGDLGSGTGDLLADAGVAKRTVSEHLADANKAWQEAVRQRTAIDGWRKELAAMQTKVRALLRPYDWSSDTIPLLAQAEALGGGSPNTGPSGTAMGQLLANAARAVAPLIAIGEGAESGLSSINVDELLTKAEQAAQEAETAANDQSAASFTSASTAMRPIAQAKKCYDELKAATGTATTPTPNTAPTFPNVSGRWSCNHNATWNITQNGDEIGGSVQYPNGGVASIGGRVKGQRVELGWRDNKKASGAIILNFAGNKPQSMTGKWIYNQTEQQKQNGTPAPPPDDEVLQRSGN